MATKPLIINGWEQGIANSPHKGFQLMKNVNIEDSPGAVIASQDTVAIPSGSVFHTPLETTFTANATTDVITITGETFPHTGTAVTVSNAGGALPTGLSAATNYFLIKVIDTTFKLATTITNAVAGTAIDITGAGTGTHTVTSVDPGTINHILYSGLVVFYLDSNGRVWYGEDGYVGLLNGNTLTNASGNGMIYFKNSDATKTYLFVFRDALVDVIEITSLANLRTPSWTNGWQSLNSAAASYNSHHAILGQDNIIYFCDKNYVGSIKENIGQVFAPGTPATYTYTNQALDLPSNDKSFWLEELGVNLLISGETKNKIYPWDRLSDSFFMPIQLPEIEVYRMKNLGNIVYVQAGRIGNVYQTQGSYARLFKKIPFGVSKNAAGSSQPVAWGGMDANAGKLVIGVDSASSGNNGIYMFYPDGRILIDNQTAGQLKPTAIYVLGTGTYFGYEGGSGSYSSTSYGGRYANYEAVIQTGLYRVATKTEKASFHTLEVVTARVPSSGTDYVRVGYRTNINPATTFTTLATFTFTSSADAIQESDIGLIDLVNVQFQIELSGNVELIEIRLT